MLESLPPIGTLDILISGIVVLCFALGLLTGFVWQLSGIASLIGGVIAVMLLGETVSLALQRWISNAQAANLLAYILTFALTGTVIRILAGFLSASLKKMKLQKYDRLFGGLLGGAKALAIAAVLIIILDRHGTTNTRTMVEDSYLAAPIVGIADFVVKKADEANITQKGKDVVERLKSVGDDTPSPPTSPAPPEESSTEEPVE